MIDQRPLSAYGQIFYHSIVSKTPLARLLYMHVKVSQGNQITKMTPGDCGLERWWKVSVRSTTQFVDCPYPLDKIRRQTR